MSTATNDGQTLSQRRARFALAGVETIKGEKFAGKFRSYAANLPPMIQMNGFGQALAFCRSKSGQSLEDQAYQALYRLVSEWLIGDDQPYKGLKDVLDGITSQSMSSYRLAQTEALALLEWVKRFASAYIEKKPAGDGSGDGDTP